MFRIEFLEVVRFFAETDKFDRQSKFFLNRDDHAAFAGAVKFGHDQARHFYRFVEFARLVQRIHPGGRVEHEQHFMGSAGQLLAEALGVCEQTTDRAGVESIRADLAALDAAAR